RAVKQLDRLRAEQLGDVPLQLGRRRFLGDLDRELAALLGAAGGQGEQQGGGGQRPEGGRGPRGERHGGTSSTKSEIRMSKSETNSKYEIPMTETDNPLFRSLGIWYWDLFRI